VEKNNLLGPLVAKKARLAHWLDANSDVKCSRPIDKIKRWVRSRLMIV
jgi:hypothetical protein